MELKTTEKVEVLTLLDSPGLDPITIVMEDVKPKHGRLIIECYGQAWSAYWGGMGTENIKEFLMSCDAEYIAAKMSRPREIKREQAYLLRIVKAVKMALQLQESR